MDELSAAKLHVLREFTSIARAAQPIKRRAWLTV